MKGSIGEREPAPPPGMGAAALSALAQGRAARGVQENKGNATPVIVCASHIQSVQMGWEARLEESEGFQWDAGNSTKIWERHRVTPTECEELFFNRPITVGEDERHSELEERFYALGQTDAGRHLFAVFTFRGRLIRVISVRDMSRKERRVFRGS